MPIDPICGMQVDSTTDLTAEHEGQTYYFCCQHCRQKFLAQGGPGPVEPSSCCHKPLVSRELDSVGSHPDHAATAAAGSGKYICPMCPGVESDRPASCPKCGMALEPSSPVVSSDDDQDELPEMTRRFWLAVALGVPVFLLAMLPMIGIPIDRWVGVATVSRWIQLLLTTPVVFWAGWPFFIRGWRSIVTWNLNMFTLICLGVTAAYLYSAVAVVWPDADSGCVSSPRAGGRLLRSRRDDHRPRATRPGSRAPRPPSYRQRDPGASRAHPTPRQSDRAKAGTGYARLRMSEWGTY